jgi:hypothetical protein
MTDTSKEEIVEAIEAAEQRGYARGIREAETACAGEYLEDEASTEDDAAYDRAVADCIVDVRALSPTPPAPVSSAVAASVLLKDIRVTTMFCDAMFKGHSVPTSYAEADAWVCDTLRALAEQEQQT